MKRKNAIITAGSLAGVLTLGSAGLVFASGSSASAPKVQAVSNVAPAGAAPALAPVTVKVKVPTDVVVVVPTTTEAPDTETADDSAAPAATDTAAATSTTEAADTETDSADTETDSADTETDSADAAKVVSPGTQRAGGDDHGPMSTAGGKGDDKGGDD